MEEKPTPRLLGGIPAVLLFLVGAAIMQVGLIKRVPVIALLGGSCGIAAGTAFLVRRELSLARMAVAVRTIPIRRFALPPVMTLLFFMVGLTAIGNATPGLVFVVRTIAVLAVALALMAVFVKRGRTQAYCAGFVILASTYEYLFSAEVQTWQFFRYYGFPPTMQDPGVVVVRHSMLMVLSGLVGGLLCLWMYSSQSTTRRNSLD